MTISVTMFLAWLALAFWLGKMTGGELERQHVFRVLRTIDHDLHRKEKDSD